MPTKIASVVAMCALAASAASADVFNMPFGLASLDMVTVANPGNAGELSGAGAGGYGLDRMCGVVNYAYNIGKYEVTAGQYAEFLNAVGGVDAYGLYNTNMWSNLYGCKIQRGGEGITGNPYAYSVAADYADRPVNYVSYGDAMRFANWLHNSQRTGSQNLLTTEDGAYYLDGATTNAELLAVSREVDWRWAVTSEDEWYKAAYHKNDGVTGNFWIYPTGTDATPNNGNPGGDTGNTANFYDGTANFNDGDYAVGTPYWATPVGCFSLSASPYGTFDQGGNLWEWNETDGASCGMRGGCWNLLSNSLLASSRFGYEPSDEYAGVGFRVASVIPEPGSLLLLGIAAISLLGYGWRRDIDRR